MAVVESLYLIDCLKLNKHFDSGVFFVLFLHFSPWPFSFFLRLILGDINTSKEGSEAQFLSSSSFLVQCRRVTRGQVALPWNPWAIRTVLGAATVWSAWTLAMWVLLWFSSPLSHWLCCLSVRCITQHIDTLCWHTLLRPAWINVTFDNVLLVKCETMRGSESGWGEIKPIWHNGQTVVLQRHVTHRRPKRLFFP